MKKEETVHFAFRSKETGRFLFHAKYPKEEVDRWEKVASLMNLSLEQFILEAIDRQIQRDIVGEDIGHK